MRHIHLLLIVAVFFSIGCNAQELSKSSIEFTAGAGIPVGAFASKENNIKSGLAMNGLVLNLEYNRYFKPKLGYFIGVKRSVFPLDVDAWTNSNPYASSEPWRLFVVYAGLATRKQFREKTILSTKGAIGVASSRYPEANIVFYNNGNPISVNYSSNTGNAPAFMIGASLKHILSQRVNVALTVDYLSTAPKFIVTEVVSNGQSYSVQSLHYTQNMQAFTIGLSLCYNFLSED